MSMSEMNEWMVGWLAGWLVAKCTILSLLSRHLKSIFSSLFLIFHLNIPNAKKYESKSVFSGIEWRTHCHLLIVFSSPLFSIPFSMSAHPAQFWLVFVPLPSFTINIIIAIVIILLLVFLAIFQIVEMPVSVECSE